MLVLTKDFINKLGGWLANPPERFMMVFLIISFFYTHSGIIMLTRDPSIYWLRDFLHAIQFLLYGSLGYGLLRRIK